MINHNDIGCALVLKQFRKDSGKKQFDVAQGLGLKDQRELSDYEHAKRSFSDQFIQTICLFFKIKEKEFRYLAKKLESVDTEQKKTVSIDREEYKIKWMLSQKENVELQLKNARLEFENHEMQCKLKSLRFNDVNKNIYVAI